MKSKWFLISGSVFYLLLLVGIPFNIHAGPLYPTGNKLNFTTSSSSLAHLMDGARYFEIQCEGGGRFCAVPSSQSRIRSGVPTSFEPCYFSELSLASKCLSPELHISLSTRKWLLGAVGGK